MCRVGIPGPEYQPVRLTAIVCVIFSLTVLFFSSQVSSRPLPPQNRSFTFEQNLGQWPETALYVAQLDQLRIVFHKHHISFISTHNSTPLLNLEFISPSPGAHVVSETPLENRSHYYSRLQEYHTKHFAQLRYQNIYPHIDIVFYEKMGTLEYDFIVKPGGSITDIGVKFDTEKAVQLLHDQLIINTSKESLRQLAPFAYQIIDSQKQEVIINQRFTNNILRFAASYYDTQRPLVIDPVVEYSASYLRGSLSDTASAVKIDAQQNIYIAGSSYSDSFKGAASTTPPNAGSRNIFIAKYLPNTQIPQFITFISGSKEDIARGLAIDTKGNVVITVETNSPDLPVIDSQSTYKGSWDAYIARISPQGGILQGFYVGGSAQDFGHAITSGPNDEIVLAGETGSQDFPTTASGFISHCSAASICGASNAFLSVFSAKGELTYSSLYGGSGRDAAHALAFDSTGTIHIGGETESSDLPLIFPTQAKFGGQVDGFIALFKPSDKNAASLHYASYLGGSATDSINSIAVDSSNRTILAGVTNSSNFPVTNNAFSHQCNLGVQGCGTDNSANDAFITLLDHSTHTRFAYSSYIGGSNDESVAAMAIDLDDRVFITGNTLSSDFPVTDNARQTHCNSLPSCKPNTDIFLVKLDLGSTRADSLLYSTYLGGDKDDQVHGIALDARNNVYLTGDTLGVLDDTSSTHESMAEDIFLYQHPQPQTGRVLRTTSSPPKSQQSASMTPFTLLVLFMIYIKKMASSRRRRT